MTSTRSATGRFAHSTCAARASAKAAWTSSAVPTGMVVSGLPVKTSLIVLVGRSAMSLIATRRRNRSKTSVDGAGMSLASRRMLEESVCRTNHQPMPSAIERSRLTGGGQEVPDQFGDFFGLLERAGVSAVRDGHQARVGNEFGDALRLVRCGRGIVGADDDQRRSGDTPALALYRLSSANGEDGLADA